MQMAGVLNSFNGIAYRMSFLTGNTFFIRNVKMDEAFLSLHVVHSGRCTVVGQLIYVLKRKVRTPRGTQILFVKDCTPYVYTVCLIASLKSKLLFEKMNLI